MLPFAPLWHPVTLEPGTRTPLRHGHRPAASVCLLGASRI